MTRIAITRALPEAERTAERIRAKGGVPLIAPLLTIVPCAYNTSTEGAQALLFTSSNGVRAFPDVRGARDRLVLTVGNATARAAHEAGFTQVHSADGDVHSLAALAKTLLDPRRGKLIHIAGDHVAGDLGGELRAAGFEVERRLAFASVAASKLPDVFHTPLDVALFHSARAAETFIQLGAPNASAMIAACLSPAIAEAASAVDWRSVIVSRAPREDALLTAAFAG